MSAKLLDAAVKILEQPLFAHFATLMKDGSPQVTPVWVDTDGEYVYVNSAEGRVKTRNVRRNPRVALSIMNPAKPYQEVLQIRGRIVEITNKGADEHIDKLAKKYLGKDRYPGRRAGEVRVIFKILPERVTGRAVQG